MIKKQIIAMGGGGFSMEPDNPLLDQYIVAQRVRLTLPYAFSLMRRMMQCVNFYKAFSKLKVRANCLSLFTPANSRP
jgi:peptidase E